MPFLFEKALGGINEVLVESVGGFIIVQMTI